MLGSRRRTIDDLLGPTPEDRASAAAPRDSWLREWPLVVGLFASTALIAASTSVGGSEARMPSTGKPQTVAAGDYAAGEVVDVGDDPAASAPAATAVDRRAERLQKRRAQRRRQAVAAKPSAPRTTAPRPARRTAPTPAAPAAPGATGGESTRDQTVSPRTGKIVNVTGTSAAFRNGPLEYHFAAPTHSPVAGRPWRLTIAATSDGAPLRGRARIDVLHDGSIVGHAASGALDGGSFAHDFDWPAESVGHPLTVKTTVIAGGVQQSFLFDVKVASAAQP
jgi:hypothetical protein